MMQFIFTRNMFMHFHALHVLFHFFLAPCLLLWLCFSLSLSLSLSHLVSSSRHPKSLFLLKTRFVMVLPFLLFPLILFGSVMRRHIITSLITFLNGRFIRNARLFCLIFQTLLYPVLLALEDGLLFVRNPRGFPTCSYRSFTPIWMPSIPLWLGLLQYSMVHVS